jgi:putative adenylate-forming enzyme
VRWGKAITAAALARSRWGLRFADRAALRRYQGRRLADFLGRVAPRAAFYWRWAGRPLAELPIVDKAAMLADFAAFNTRGVTLERAMAVARRAEESRDFAPTLDGLTVGLSSGTSGSRGVFLVSPGERARWAGALLARTLSGASLRRLLDVRRPPLRVAFFLRANSNLYATLGSRRLDFRFHDLLDGFETHVRRLNLDRPDILAAPPTVLRRLADAASAGELRIAPAQVLSVAEVLEADDESAVAGAFGVPVQQIYQASEGFLGASCAAGRVHLNEELVHVETEWLPGEEGRRFQPIVTDFSRTTQLVVRYRLDDVLRVADGPCACGQVTLGLAAIEGRADDVLWALPAVAETSAADQGESESNGERRLVPVFPDVLRRAFALADHGGGVPGDYRLEQQGDVWNVRLRGAAAGQAADQVAVRGELEALARRQGFRLPALHFEAWRAEPLHQKRRRIRCIAKPGARQAAAP